MVHVKYTLHEYREGRHALAGDDLCTGPLLAFVTDYAENLKGLKYVVVETRTEFIREDGWDGMLEYDERAYAVITRGRAGEGFSMNPWMPFTEDMYALVDVRVSWPPACETGPAVSVGMSSVLGASVRARLLEYIDGGLLAVFGAEPRGALPEAGDRMDDFLNAMAHRLVGDA